MLPDGRVMCPVCKSLLDHEDFEFNMSARRRNCKECKVCKHQRLAREHDREAERLLKARRRKRATYQARVEAARAAAGRD